MGNFTTTLNGEKQMTTINAIIYARFSPRRRSEESESNELQKAHCEQHAFNKKYEIAGFFEDKALSGSDIERPALWAAVDVLKKGDVLLVYKLDRLARNVYLMELIKQAVSACGARIEAVEGDVAGDSAESVLIRQMLSAFSEYERKLIGIRTKFAMIQHQRNGKRMGRFAPYGFRVDLKDQTLLTPNLKEQKAVTRILQLRDDKFGDLQIVRVMNREGMFLPRDGKPWTRRQIEKILSNHLGRG